MKYIPVAEPFLGKEEEKLVLEGLRSGWISSIGKYIPQFEEEFARYCGVRYGVTCSNGTTALHLALVACDVGPGDEVIVPSMTFVATANAVVYTGAKPVLIDSEPDTWNIDPEKIKEKITRRTRAIIPVHLYGHPADMGPILSIARKYGLTVIEDAAEAHGAMYKQKMVGSLSDMACFSFFGNKIITTGEGGMLITNNKALAEKAKMLRDHGVSKKRRYYHPHLGYNYRMTNLQAALGLAQLAKIDKIIAAKRQLAQKYQQFLSPVAHKLVLHPEAKWAKNVFWMYSVLVKPRKNITRDRLAKYLKRAGIDSRPFFFPIHKLARYKVDERLPVADFLASAGLNLPSSVNLTEEQIKYISHKIIQFLG
ncbi:DegT/DnrJ/EryC1/StrS family aminotransferase [Candidatus Daviesbacteria bacterium]|nr:DegT/DnrJ/EryC1/StrS family aminotransferase [Candidatus Daviesbacteria bacterium]